MGHKVNPLAFRLNQTFNWKSGWFSNKKYREYLEEDLKIRKFLTGKLKSAGVNVIEINRSANIIKITIKAARPGLIIGRAGTGIEDLKKSADKVLRDIPVRPWGLGLVNLNKKEIKQRRDIKITVEELKKPDIWATVVGQDIADQLERRIPFRGVLKKTIERVMQNQEVEGVKVALAGRLDGSEMARREWLVKGKIPLQTLRADIDFSTTNAYTIYGVVGIKVWIYKGEVFKDKISEQNLETRNAK